MIDSVESLKSENERLRKELEIERNYMRSYREAYTRALVVRGRYKDALVEITATCTGRALRLAEHALRGER